MVAVDRLDNGAQPLLARPIEERRARKSVVHAMPRSNQHFLKSPAVFAKVVYLPGNAGGILLSGFLTECACPPCYLFQMFSHGFSVPICIWRFGKIDCVFRPIHGKDSPTFCLPKFHMPKSKKRSAEHKPPR